MKTILKVVVISLFAGFLMVGALNATPIYDNSNPSSEKDLYEIFFDEFGIDYVTSDLLFSARGLADADDDLWFETNGHIELTVRYAGYAQELGTIDGDGNYTSQVTGIITGENDISVEFVTDGGNFALVEKYTPGGGSSGYWYSDDRNSSNDHFVAFDVSDLVAGVDNAWMIAFEDLDLGDRDYNDLVAIVTEIAPFSVPEPSLVFLGATCLLGLAGAGMRRRKR